MSRQHDPADDTRPEPEVPVLVTSLYGARTRRALVKLEIGKEAWMFSPAEARRIARLLSEGADAADLDEFLMTYFVGDLGLADQQAAAMLAHVRMARLAKYGDRI